MSIGVKSACSAEAESKRALLAERLAEAIIAPAPAPLSFAQQRLWFLDQLEPDSSLYNIGVLARLTGRLDPAVLQGAIQAIVSRHEALRTRFLTLNESPVQMVDAERAVELPCVDISSLPEAERKAEAQRLARVEVNRPFNLSSDRLMRVTLYRLRPEEHQLLVVVHHIASDEWSMRIFFRELVGNYKSLLDGEPANAPELPIQYADYSVWQREWLSGEVLEKQLAYWKERLHGNPPITELAADHPRRSPPSIRGGNEARMLGMELGVALKLLAQNQGATCFMVLLAAFNALLYRYTRQEDIILGTPAAGRNHLETENLIGLFVNTLLLRTSLAGNPTFLELLARVRDTTIGAYAHQDLPFEKLVQELRPDRTFTQLPFARMMFLTQEPLGPMELPDLRLEFLELESDLSKFEATLMVQDTREGLVLRVEYNRDLFEPATMARFLTHYEQMLKGIVAVPAQHISELPLLAEAERHQLLLDWNDTGTEYPRRRCIHHLFEAQAERSPEAIAVAYGRHALSYRELNMRADRLAQRLQTFGVGPDVPVGLCLEPSVDVVIGMLAILKAGGAYLPLDPTYPRERLAFMLSDAQAPVIVTQKNLLQILPTTTSKVICVDVADQEFCERDAVKRKTKSLAVLTPEHLAYIIYTSGSSGQPKGVAIPHRGVTRLVLDTNYVRLDATDRIAQVSNLSFDAATFEVWGALLNGGRLVGIPKEVILSSKDFARELRELGITAMFLTAAVFHKVAAEAPGAFGTLRTLIAGGEALDPKWVRAVLRDHAPQRLINGYGPTENTTFTCCHWIRELSSESLHVPIGRPIANTQVYILDPHLNPVPIGVPGELYTGGDGLARGYWKRPELTAEKFIANPFAIQPAAESAHKAPGGNPGNTTGLSALLYRTGDLARYLPDGNIEFLGRLDEQVKIRGYRIELGEIEAVLGRHPCVRECAVTVISDATANKRLAAYIVSSNGQAADSAILREFLQATLPDYMVPAYFVPLQSLPLTPNGKVDRQALPRTELVGLASAKKFTPPRDSLEKQLTEIWERVLAMRPVGVTDKFFELGGHSLLAVRLIAEIEKVFGKRLRVATIFQSPTIEQLAAILRGEIPECLKTGSSLVEIQEHGARPPLFLVHGAGGGMFWGYANLSSHLGKEQSVYGFKSPGLDGGEELDSIEAMAARYLADLRAVQPRGPYRLGGYCFGGNVAYEMARQLSVQGEEIALLALFNCAPPNSRYTQIPWGPRWSLRFLRNLVYWSKYFRHWSANQRREFFRWKWSLFKKRFGAASRPGTNITAGLEAGELVDLSSFTEEERRIWEAHIRALLRFHPQPFPGRVHLFRSPGHPLWCSFDPDYGWGDFAKGGVSTTVVPGAHEKILQEPCVAVLARELERALDPTRASVPAQATALRSADADADQDSPQSAKDRKPVPGASQNSGASTRVTYADLFLARVKQSPDAVAVRFGDQRLSYSELDSRAERLAVMLEELGIGPEVLVGVFLERSLDLVAALLAIWKAGGAYLPLDPDYPKERLSFMLEDSRAPVVLTCRGLRRRLPSTNAKVICLDAPDDRPAREVEGSRAVAAARGTTWEQVDPLAYVIYTSGSTGQPKGVEITQSALVSHNQAIGQAYQLRPEDLVLQFSPVSFDISVEEIFPSLLNGATVVLRSEEAVSTPGQFLEFVRKERITVLNLPTAYWHELVDWLERGGNGLPDSVRLVVIGGEAASESAYARWKKYVGPGVTLVNAYGVTEATVTTTLWVAHPSEDSLSIGRPIARTQVLLLDEQLQPVPAGTVAELYIGGKGVGRGYLNRPDLTASRFFPNPFPQGIGSERLFRTGDLARIRPDGNLEFLGRVDDQVKLRGYRIEPGEIASVLREHPAVKDAVVMLRADEPGNQRLVGYFVAREALTPPLSELRGFLKQRLPAYMVPVTFVALDALPLNPAGKIDRQALPAPNQSRPELSPSFIPPGTPSEAALAAIWSDVLGVSPIGIQDNFFELGGHSLVAMQAISRIRDDLQVEISLPEFFARPTVAELAAHLDDWQFWKGQLGSAPPVLELPADRSRPARQSEHIDCVPVELSESLMATLETLSQREGTTLVVTLLAGYATLLHRYTGSTDLVLGVLAEASHSSSQPGTGSAKPPIVVRCNLEGDPSFNELIARLGRVVNESTAHSGVAFSRLVESLCPERNASYAPLFQTLLIVQENNAAEFSCDTSTKPPHDKPPLSAPNRLNGQWQPERGSNGDGFTGQNDAEIKRQQDLIMRLVRTSGSARGEILFRTDLFDRARILRMREHWLTLLAGAAAEPTKKISGLPLLCSEEAHQILVQWNRTEKDYPRQKTLVDLFLDQVARTPLAEAIISGNQRVNYARLYERAAQIGKCLQELGVGPECLVGLCVDRSVDMIAAMLGTLMAGGAYVPLDPEYPSDRLAFILEDSRARVLVTRQKLLDHLPKTNSQVLLLDELAAPAQMETIQTEELCNARPQHLAYVIYTSGSTGRPKGVALEHRSAVAFVHWAKELFSPEDLAGVLGSTSICFDLSIFEIFATLSWGGKILLAQNALALPGLPTAGEVTLLNTVPSAIRELLRLKSVPQSVRVINLAGEPLDPQLVDQIYRETNADRVYDLYGPTETTTYSTCALRQAGAPATIGRPLANQRVYLLNARLQPVPIGIPGEVFIGGAGLARGYLDRPELTAEKFIADPFQAGARLYRTGDQARWRADGNLEFLGRLDHQVKIRGFRVELGEIQSVLKAVPGVREAAVVACHDQSGNTRVVAYVVPSLGGRGSAPELRQGLRAKLPEFMVPAAFVFLDQLPLTPNGKLDRKALPAPQESQVNPIPDGDSPRTELAEKLLAIWREVLRLDNIGLRDNFFDLGGHSLLAAQVISRIREVLNVELSLFALFEAPTVAELARALETSDVAQPQPIASQLIPAPHRDEYASSFVQERLWFLQQLEPTSHAYHVPTALQLTGELDRVALQRSLDEIIRRHASLRTVFHYTEGGLTQVVNADLSLEIQAVDLRAGTISVAEKFGAARSCRNGKLVKSAHEELAFPGAVSLTSQAQAWLEAETQRPFDLERGPLIRVSLAQLAEAEHLLLVVVHHTVFDGWSLDLFFKELGQLYDVFVAGEVAPLLPELPVSYVDFAHWQRQTMRGGTLEQELTYWRAKLSGAPPKVELPVEYAGPEPATGRAAQSVVTLEESLARAIADLGQRTACTPFMLLMTALAITLHKWTGQKDLVLGTVVAGRNRRQIENLIGCFMNFLPIRVQIDDQESGSELVTKVRGTVLEGQTHQDCPFEKIVEVVNPERQHNQNPLYNVALLVQNFPNELFRSRSLRAKLLPMVAQEALLDLRFEAEQTSEGLSLTCEYRRELFEAKTVNDLLASFLEVLAILARNPDTALKDFRVSPELAARAKMAPAPEVRRKIVITATFTAEPIAEPLRYWLGELDLPDAIEFAPYNQVFQQLLDPTSQLATNPSGLNVLLVRLEDWQHSGSAPNQAGAPTQEETLRRNATEFVLALKEAVVRNGVPHLVCICPPSAAVRADSDRSTVLGQTQALLAAELAGLGGVYLLTAAELGQWYPVMEYYDASGEALGHVPYTPVFFTALATAIARKLHALSRPPFKVIVLDCDQTLWSGVCGEDGPLGISVEGPRLALQQFMCAQHDAGMLLCLCSKNNEEDVLEVLARRKDMPLRREHFIAWRLNWQPKSENLKSLAQELGLGLDSFIFLDDNPVECAEVQANCPEVQTFQLPEDPALLPQFLEHCWAFDHLRLTAEDRRRPELYRQNRQREQLRAASPNLADFLASLDLRVHIQPMAPAQRPRVGQLILRTNQFNCTSRRLTERELGELGNRRELITVEVSDRFGDYGLVGAMSFQAGHNALAVDLFLLSCRVLGRGVEHRMLAHLGETARRQQVSWVDVHFIPTSRNKPALDFLERVGAGFKQPLNGGFLVRFPARYAAELRYQPAPAETGAPVTAQPTRPEGRKKNQGASKFTRYREIALEANEPEKIHQNIRARTALRAGKKADYAMPRTELEQRLCALWQELLHVERVGVRDNFFELGGHSLLAVRLFAEIEKLTGRKFPLVTVFQAPTVAELGRVLGQQSATPASPLLVPIQPHGSKPPLFLVHGAGGDVLWGYANLAAYLPPDQPIYGIKSRGQAGFEEVPRLTQMAECYLEAIRAFQPQGPYYLGGYCFGGNVAYEIARLLQSKGEPVALVALIDSSPANAGYETVAWLRPDFCVRFARNFSYWLRDFAALPALERRQFVARKLRFFGRKWARKLRPGNGAAPVDLEEVIELRHFPEHELKLWQIHLQALAEHVERPYSGTVTLLRTRGQALFCSLAEDFCWGKLAPGRVLMKYVPGSHENIFMEPNVQTLASELAAALARAQPVGNSQRSQPELCRI